MKYLPALKPDILVIDPPWRWEAFSEKGEDRSAKKHYNVEFTDLLAQIPVADLLQDHTAVFLWVTDPMLPQAMDLVGKWGMRYSTVGFYWHKECKNSNKDAIGNGYVTRGNTEQVWFLRKKNSKKMLPRQNKGVRRLQHTYEDDLGIENSIRTKVGRHSEKPEIIQDKIEALFGTEFIEPDGSSRPMIMLELFARRHREKWITMGLELDGMTHDVSIPLYLSGKYPKREEVNNGT
jgi:N6-adenosine-specific RNA methylase IME4